MTGKQLVVFRIQRQKRWSYSAMGSCKFQSSKIVSSPRVEACFVVALHPCQGLTTRPDMETILSREGAGLSVTLKKR